jgi:probable HAF family extracellular repeat protein
MASSRKQGFRAFFIVCLWIFVGHVPGLSADPLYYVRDFTNSRISNPNNLGQLASPVSSAIDSNLSSIALFNGFGPQAGQPGQQLVPPSGAVSGVSQIFLNDNGQVALPGVIFPGGQTQYQGAILSNGTVTSIGTLGGAASDATAINNAGEVTGLANTTNGGVHAFLYSGGATTDLGTLPGGQYSGALGINNAGQVVGFSDTGNGVPLNGPLFQVPNYAGGYFWNSDVNAYATAHATLFTHGQKIDLGTLGGQSSYASGINDSGTIVGASQIASGVTHAFVYMSGKMTDLGVLNTDVKSSLFGNAYSAATGINNAGEIVGSSNSRAFLYENGKMLDLNNLVSLPPGVTLMAAFSINNLGQIAAEGVSLENGIGYHFYAYLLTPTSLPDPTYAIPEPSLLEFSGLFFAGLVGIRAIARLRGRRDGHAR